MGAIPCKFAIGVLSAEEYIEQRLLPMLRDSQSEVRRQAKWARWMITMNVGLIESRIEMIYVLVYIPLKIGFKLIKSDHFRVFYVWENFIFS